MTKTLSRKMFVPSLTIVLLCLVSNFTVLANVTITSTVTSMSTKTATAVSTLTQTLTYPYTSTTYVSTITKGEPWSSTTTHTVTSLSHIATPMFVTHTSTTTTTTTITSRTTVTSVKTLSPTSVVTITSITSQGYLTVRTNKSSYHPGEPVRISGEPVTPSITWSYTYTASHGMGLEVEIRILDPSGRIIHAGRSNRNTASYKRYAYDYTLPNNAAPGTYRIQAIYTHSAFSITGATTFKVEEAYKLAKWTFMFYMSTDDRRWDEDNWLEREADKDLNEMEKVGSNHDINIIAMLDRRNSNRAYIYKVIKEGYPSNTIVSLILRDLGPTNMGHPQTLQDFITWTSVNYPALNYALVLWGHGGSFLGICWDHGVSADERLELTELDGALNRAGVHFGMILFMACLMGSIEVAFQIRRYGDYMVAFETTTERVWHLDSILGHVRNNPTISARNLASFILVFVESAYTISQLDLSQLNNLSDAVDNFARMLNDNIVKYKKQVERARRSVEGTVGYGDLYRQFVDLYRFAEEIYNLSVNGTIADRSIKLAAWDVMMAVRDTVTKSRSGEYSRATGISIFFPVLSLSSLWADYGQTSFANSNAWVKFLDRYYDAATLLTVYGPRVRE